MDGKSNYKPGTLLEKGSLRSLAPYIQFLFFFMNIKCSESNFLDILPLRFEVYIKGMHGQVCVRNVHKFLILCVNLFEKCD